MGSKDLKNTDGALEAVAKILPSEITAVYLAIRSVVQVVNQGSGDLAPYVLFLTMVALAVIAPFFSQLMGYVTDRSHMMFLSISFVLWAINIDFERFLSITPSGLGVVFSYAAPIALIMWAGLASPAYLHYRRSNFPSLQRRKNDG